MGYNMGYVFGQLDLFYSVEFIPGNATSEWVIPFALFALEVNQFIDLQRTVQTLSAYLLGMQ